MSVINRVLKIAHWKNALRESSELVGEPSCSDRAAPILVGEPAAAVIAPLDKPADVDRCQFSFRRIRFYYLDTVTARCIIAVITRGGPGVELSAVTVFY